MTDTAHCFKLPASLGAADAATLAKALVERRGAPLTLQADGVRRLGAQSVQVLLAATATWRADGFSLDLAEGSHEFLDGLRLMGLSLKDVTVGEPTA